MWIQLLNPEAAHTDHRRLTAPPSLRAGLCTTCIRALRLFQRLNEASAAGESVAFASVVLQAVGLAGDGAAAREILAQGDPPELRRLLLSAVQRGAEATAGWSSRWTSSSFGFFKLEVYSAMAVAVLFGRVESDESSDGEAITVPTAIIDKCLLQFREILVSVSHLKIKSRTCHVPFCTYKS